MLYVVCVTTKTKFIIWTVIRRKLFSVIAFHAVHREGDTFLPSVQNYSHSYVCHIENFSVENFETVTLFEFLLIRLFDLFKVLAKFDLQKFDRKFFFYNLLITFLQSLQIFHTCTNKEPFSYQNCNNRMTATDIWCLTSHSIRLHILPSKAECLNKNSGKSRFWYL